MTVEMEIGRKAAQILDEKLSALSSVEDRIALIASQISGRVAFSTSLGIEDQALLHAISKAGAGGAGDAGGGDGKSEGRAKVDVDVFTLDTGRHFPETLETLERSELRYNRRIRVVVPEASDVEELVARDGIFGFRASVEARKSCCDVRKVRPLRRALLGASAWITGMRRGQSSERMGVAFASWDDEHALIKLNPIADWSIEQLTAYVGDNDVPINPLHARGYPSIGCQTCTRAISAGEDERAGRWWWENEDGKECGLHVSAYEPNPKAKPSVGDAGTDSDKSEGLPA